MPKRLINHLKIILRIMIMFKIQINDRNYYSWEVFDTNKFTKVNININPLENKMLTNDIFTVDENNKINIKQSTIRSGPPIPGVLILDGNKSYGRQTKQLTKGKLLYKCIPDDIRIPIFLVPYEIKNMGFSKVFKNLYVTINFDEWENKHPIGKLDNVIGSVDILDIFYEYQLYCKSLNTSIQKFQKDTIKNINKKSHDTIIENIISKYSNIQDRTNQKHWNVITIDPNNSLDYDDGFGMIKLNDGVKQLSIYISNVTLWIDVLNLWNSFSKRISTIYLPDKKRPMLPTILSDGLCSLQANIKRFAFVMDIFIKNNQIVNINFCNAVIKVTKNYIYEEPNLLSNPTYYDILETTQELSKNYQYINNVRNSHELVCYLMIFMNYNCAKELLQYKTGIFRSTIIKKDYIIPDTLPEEVSKFVKIWNSGSGQYIDGSKIDDMRHEHLDVDAYVHISSPIRRLVDLLNMIKFQSVNNMIVFSENAQNFYKTWLNELNYINITMRSIRRVQCDCSLLDLCYNNPTVLEKEYDGYLFDKINRNDGLYQYLVFLPELKLSSKVILRDDFDNFIKKQFKLYLFNDEERFKKKIRLHLS